MKSEKYHIICLSCKYTKTTKRTNDKRITIELMILTVKETVGIKG